ncbi:MAG: 50S ribosomal protein L9 [Planctomycetes bacterium]|nr:50S ribosomal protein L9 [Planctomycetota bacterium]
MRELLLVKDVRKLGYVGDVVKVKEGYARNYLLPQRLATEPTAENTKAIETAKQAAAADRARKTREFQEIVTRMKDVSVTIEAAANPEGTLYGSVGPKEIAVALQAQGFAVLPDHVALDVPIRTLDNRMVKLEFTDEVETQVKVWVVREGGETNAEPGAADAEPAAAEDAE